ncbi:MAG TPA: cyanophycinase [Chloroflexia bacterium]|nr:cyanophycinase [Chloroflexia bacterium]
MTQSKTKGSLIIIGGHEDKEGQRVILNEVAARVKKRKGCLAIVTVASSLPQELASGYRKVFKELGVDDVQHVDVRIREDATSEENVQRVVNASVIFFTGGDQLRITSQIGDSPLFRCMRDMHIAGGTIVGTSAGAAAMSETMLISGPGDKSNEIFTLGMAPGLGFIDGVVVDSHFAERGRMGRLLGAVAQNPRNLGLGIDENTAVITNGDGTIRILGSGAVYVVDGSDVAYSSLSDENPEGMLSIFGIKLDVLREGDVYDLPGRRPLIPEMAGQR